MELEDIHFPLSKLVRDTSVSFKPNDHGYTARQMGEKIVLGQVIIHQSIVYIIFYM